MKILLAPDSYKGCLTSPEVASAAAAGIRCVLPGADIVSIPLADGGEGTVGALTACLGGTMVHAVVSDPLGRPVDASYCKAGDLAVIESASACGITLLDKSELNPLAASSAGLGELILDALGRGCRRFIIGLGGSATNDGGRGMVEIPGLIAAASGASFTVACDVDTPLTGLLGASRVFGPQKGASPKDVEILEVRMEEWALKIMKDTGADVRHIPGAGAAGGLGAAFLAYLGAELRPGADMVLDAAGFDAALDGADLVITGEGCSDFQTPMGKVPSAVLRRALAEGVPVALMSGAVHHCPELDSLGFRSMTAVSPAGMSLQEAMDPRTAAANIRAAAGSICSSLLLQP